MKHLKYLKYVVIHKWYVMLQCFRFGIYWRGITHDISKFYPSEWFPYVNRFFGNNKDEFSLAWLRHQNRNDHHWQWWILQEDRGHYAIYKKMSMEATLEMLCDWYGASRAQGKGGWNGVKKWYNKNKDNMKLHLDTRDFIEIFLEGVV